MDYLMPNKFELPCQPASLETVDTGFYETVDKNFNIHTVTSDGFVKVPVLWLGAERAFQVKNDKEIRDSVGKLKLPLITIERTSLSKDPSFKGAVQADMRPIKDGVRDYRGGAFRLLSRINQEKTSQLQAAKNARDFSPSKRSYPSYGTTVVFDEYYIPVPTYVAITYSITVRTEYQQQMNQIVMPFITRTGQLNHFVFKKDNHSFEAFIQQDFAAENNLSSMAEDERTFKTKIDVKVLGYLIGEGINEERPKVIKRETVVKLEAPIETLLSPLGTGGRGNIIRKIGDKEFIAQKVDATDDVAFNAKQNPDIDVTKIPEGAIKRVKSDYYVNMDIDDTISDAPEIEIIEKD